MKESDKKNIIIILATLVTSILSLGIFNLLFQLIFIIIFVIICCLGFSYINNKSNIKRNFLILSCAAEVIILCFSISNQGSFFSFYKQITNFFVASHEKSDFDFNEFGNQLKNIDEKIDDTKDNIQNIDNNLNSITYNLDKIHYNQNIDEVESADILKLIKDRFKEYSDRFPTLITDIYSIELFYKAFISESPYYYCNILDAFNNYGINTDKLGINENTLFIWDIEKLYMTYNMKTSIANELESDKIFDIKIFKYNEYKVKLNRFSDTFDYGDWQKYFTDKTPKQIDDLMNKSIMTLYKKFVINFSIE